MIDLQTAADGVGELRVRHVGGTEGILAGIAFAADGPMWATPGGAVMPLQSPRPTFTVALDDGGRLEAPQASFEALS